MSGEASALSRRPSLLRNYFALAGSNLVSQLLNFGVLVYLARILEIEVFGDIVIAQTTALYLRLSADMGLEMSGTRRVAAGAGDVSAVVARFIGYRLVNAVVTCVIAAAVLLAVRPSPRLSSLIAAYALSVLPLAFLLEWAYSGLERMGVVALSRVAAGAMNLVLVLVLVRSAADALRVPLAYTLGLACSACWLAWRFGREHGVRPVRVDLRAWSDAIRSSVPLGLSFITIQVYYSVGTLLLGAMDGSRAAGLYVAPQRIVLFLTGLAGLFGASLYPRLVALRAGDHAQYEKVVQLAVRVTLLLGLPMAVGGFLVAPALVPFLYGKGFAESVVVLRVLAWQAFTVFANVPFAYALLAAGRQKPYFRSVLAGAVLNMVANLVLIPRLHATGAALAQLSSEWLVLLLLVWAARDVTSARLARVLTRALPAVATMAVCLVLVASMPLLVQLGAAFCAYVGGLLVFRALTVPDARQLVEALRRS